MVRVSFPICTEAHDKFVIAVKSWLAFQPEIKLTGQEKKKQLSFNGKKIKNVWIQKILYFQRYLAEAIGKICHGKDLQEKQNL